MLLSSNSLEKNFNLIYKMPITRIAIGTPGEASHPDAMKAALAEFFSTLIFVFAGEGSGMAFSKIDVSIGFDFNVIESCFPLNCNLLLILDWTQIL